MLAKAAAVSGALPPPARCCVLSQAMVSPCKLTLRKTGGLDISLKEASSSRSVRVPPGKEMSSAFVDTYREG